MINNRFRVISPTLHTTSLLSLTTIIRTVIPVSASTYDVIYMIRVNDIVIRIILVLKWFSSFFILFSF